MLDTQGWGAWPVCSVKAGARGGSSAVGASHAKKSVKKHTSHVKLSGRTYTVRSGDTLAKIAAKLHVKGGWHRLASANHLANPNRIHVGQRLHLPA